MRLTRHRRTRRTHRRGFTLIEIMVVVTILGLLAGGIAVAVMHHFASARLTTARTQALNLRHVAESWRMAHAADECPTGDALVDGGMLDEASKLTDPWDRAYEITCDGEHTRVRSFGPDRRKGTDDDIFVPPPRDGQKVARSASRDRPDDQYGNPQAA